MIYSEFINKMQEQLQRMYGTAVIIETTTVQKNNGVILQGLTIRKKGEFVAPTIYLEKFYGDYEGGMPFSKILEDFQTIYEGRNEPTVPDFDFFEDYDKVKAHLAFKLINREMNMPLLQEVPYVEFLNLAVVFYCQVSSPKIGNGTVLIRNNHMECWNVTKHQLYQDALENTPEILPGLIQSMEEVMKEIIREKIQHDILENRLERTCSFDGLEGAENLDDHPESLLQNETYVEMLVENMYHAELGINEKVPMMILTNRQKHFGAACILYPKLLQEYADKIKKNLYVLPSSIHEVILLPESEFDDSCELQRMVREVNDTQLDPEELLSGSVYYFDRETREISIALE